MRAWTVRILTALTGMLAGSTFAAGGLVEHDPGARQVMLSDTGGQLVLRLKYDGRCVIDQMRVRGREVLAGTGVWTGIKAGGQWFTTREDIVTPHVAAHSNTVTVTGIRLERAGVQLSEAWSLTVHADRIVWRIDRTYESGGVLEDTCSPGWDFRDMATWTGGLLGHGGVVWGKLFDAPDASYGVHNGKVTFWNLEQQACLRLAPTSPSDSKIAVRFSRQPNGVFSSSYSVGESEWLPRHGNSRFQRNRQDIWRPQPVKPGQVSVEFTLSALDYEEAYPRGVFKGVSGGAIREICHTIARIGAVDELIMGSNGYYSDCAVLHEPWIGQLGLAINDPDYTRAMGDTLDFQRQHAIGPGGRVKSRWAGGPGDSMPGTYDAFGYYECQWGWLMDSQPSWVINVAEQFDFTGDRRWLQQQKSACEQALDYLLRRDADNDGLLEMMTDSTAEAKGSDWIDVVWAAHENALVNSQMFWAMSLWADLEELLGDTAQATRYRAAANKLKHAFNKSTRDGGFWDAQNQCYAYWRDKDDSVHGANLVVPVNFSAIGYGLCDDPARRGAILDRIERLMQQERLFSWPLCFFSYAKEEVHPGVNWPFPAYENGDIFLAWGELGTRAYSAHNPAVALKYVRAVLDQYARDGLAFQRYLRRSQAGAGNDILANNGSIVVGLYRNLYGVQPKHNRLYLEPHLVPELNGTQLNYWHRGQRYHIELSEDNYSVGASNYFVHDRRPFAVNVEKGTLQYFAGLSRTHAMAITAATSDRLDLDVISWPEAISGTRVWRETCRRPGGVAQHVISGLSPNRSHTLSRNRITIERLQTNAAGELLFDCTFPDSTPIDFELEPAP